MKNKKYIIILLIILLIILVVGIMIILFSLLKQKNNQENISQVDDKLAEDITISELEPEGNMYIYITSNEIINTFFNYISEKEPNADNSEAAISLLDKEFITQNNVTEENILKKFSNYKNINSYSAREIYCQEINHRQNINGEYLYIKGKLRTDGEENDIYILLKRDLINSTYSISFIEEDIFNNMKTGKNSNTDTDINIEKNDYNEIYSKMINEYEICLMFFRDYINTIQNNSRYGYELLDEEYKNSRFGSLEKYETYINNISNRLDLLALRGYNISEKSNYKQYACVDQYGNNYIFINTKGMYYTVILDTYTLDLPEFIEKYDAGNDETKLTLNVGKIIEAINNKDYEYVYNKMNETFRNNNFSNISTLEQFINNHFYNINEVQDFSYRQEGKVFICTIGLKNKEKSSDTIKSITILMELKDNRNFEISFSI